MMDRFVLRDDLPHYEQLLMQTSAGPAEGNPAGVAHGAAVAVHLSISSFESGTVCSGCAVITELTEPSGTEQGGPRAVHSSQQRLRRYERAELL